MSSISCYSRILRTWYSAGVGKVEVAAKQKRRKDFIQHAVLSTLGVAGMLALVAVAPNALRMLDMFGADRRFSYKTKTALGRLAAKGYIRFFVKNGVKKVAITDQGRRALDLDTKLDRVLTHRPKCWDKRWRLIMFDIPERQKIQRDYLRTFMHEVGFFRFQDSVWIYPYDCEDLVTLLKIEKGLGNAVRYAVVEKLENDDSLRKHFDV